MGKTADLTVVQKTIIDTLHTEGKPQTSLPKKLAVHGVESMPRRIKAVLNAKGGPTRYWQGVPNKVASECIYAYEFLNPGLSLSSVKFMKFACGCR